MTESPLDSDRVQHIEATRSYGELWYRTVNTAAERSNDAIREGRQDDAFSAENQVGGDLMDHDYDDNASDSEYKDDGPTDGEDENEEFQEVETEEDNSPVQKRSFRSGSSSRRSKTKGETAGKNKAKAMSYYISPRVVQRELGLERGIWNRLNTAILNSIQEHELMNIRFDQKGLNNSKGLSNPACTKMLSELSKIKSNFALYFAEEVSDERIDRLLWAQARYIKRKAAWSYERQKEYLKKKQERLEAQEQLIKDWRKRDDLTVEQVNTMLELEDKIAEEKRKEEIKKQKRMESDRRFKRKAAALRRAMKTDTEAEEENMDVDVASDNDSDNEMIAMTNANVDIEWAEAPNKIGTDDDEGQSVIPTDGMEADGPHMDPGGEISASTPQEMPPESPVLNQGSSSVVSKVNEITTTPTQPTTTE
jgi:hypothetical protein